MPSWSMPSRCKIFEALGTISDKRLEFEGGSAKCYSSSRRKFYTITYDPSKNAIMCNDNSSYYVGSLGYPAIAFLMMKGVLKYDPKHAELFKDIAWKDMNQKFKNDFSKTEEQVLNLASLRGGNRQELLEYANKTLEYIKALNLQMLGARIKPPEGY